MVDPFENLDLAANALAGELQRLSILLGDSGPLRIVLAESCTCGLAAAALGRVPGISQFFCGSSVTYRAPTKTAWLDVPAAMWQQYTAESPVVAETMAWQILQRTPEAQWSAAITGHLGPGAPRDPQGHDLTGTVHLAVARRDGETCRLLWSRSCQLAPEFSTRAQLQGAAAVELLGTLRQQLLTHYEKQSGFVLTAK